MASSPALAAPRRRPASAPVAVAVAAAALLAAGAVWDLSIGARSMSPGEVLGDLFTRSGSLSAEIVRMIRLPRVLMAALIGLDLGIAGVVMQGVTANPLAAPDLIGISAGAALVVVAAATVFAQVHGVALVLLSVAGAGASAFAVLGLAGAGQGRTSPVRLALAGVTLTAMLLAFTQALILFHQQGTAGVFFWLVGGVNFAQWSDLAVAAPWAVAGVAGAVLLAHALNVLALGDDTARGLGLNVDRARLLGVLCVVGLAGPAVAVSGPVAFIGVIVPHTTRRLVGSNHLLVIPLAGLLGATLLMFADVGSRYVQFPFETPSGIVTSLVGAPFFLYLARRQKATL
jgi:ABC-type Fe3+-siderophore transport system permease subunit